MLTMNYQGLQYNYSRYKGHKNPVSSFSIYQWKDKKEWIKEQKEKEEIKKKLSKLKKKKKCKDTKVKGKKAVRGAKKALTLKEKYYQQLEHPLWLKKRNIILERDQHKCVLCGSTENLQVHHKKYFKGRYAWEYANSTLVTLCKDCHNKVHQDRNNELYPQFF